MFTEVCVSRIAWDILTLKGFSLVFLTFKCNGVAVLLFAKWGNPSLEAFLAQAPSRHCL